MKTSHIACLICCIACIPVISASGPPDDTYQTENRLFHVERSKNKNIVCYDFNDHMANKTDDPVYIYWINREERPGQPGELSYIQRKMAYGYSVLDKTNGVITIELNAVKSKKLLIRQEGSRYICQVDINQQPSVLQKVYVKTKSNNSIQVEYVDIFGNSLDTGLSIKERIYR